MPLRQPLLFDARQRRPAKRERWAIYDAVLALRRRGHVVYRAGGGMHKIDGKRLPTTALLATARAATISPAEIA